MLVQVWPMIMGLVWFILYNEIQLYSFRRTSKGNYDKDYRRFWR